LMDSIENVGVKRLAARASITNRNQSRIDNVTISFFYCGIITTMLKTLPTKSRLSSNSKKQTRSH
jgi:hypothetical protein